MAVAATARKGREKAIELTPEQHAMACENYRLAYKAMRLWLRYYPTLSEDEVLSGCFLALFVAASDWEPGRAAFSTWHMSKCRSVLSHDAAKARIVRTPQRGPRLSAVPGYDLDTIAEPDDTENTVEAAEERCRVSEALSAAIGSLGPRYALVLRRTFLEGATLAEVGREIGVCKERVRQLKEEALRKLRKAHKLRALCHTN